MPLPTEPKPNAPGGGGAFGPYRILRELGRGGMGAVYLALDTRLDREVALKTMLPEFAANAVAKERFLREARAAARLAHDHVVAVHEADERNGIPYIAMQFLHGASLADRLKERGLTLPEAVRVGRETALGLAAAHAQGVIHRDIKPANLWIEAPSGRVKILDFGLARPTAESDLTRSGAILGTPAYMSPEQAKAEKVDHRTDLFSLGAVLYQLCTGYKPFDGPTAIAVLMALGTAEPHPVRERNPNVPEPLAALIHQLLAKSPHHRPQSAEEVADRLRVIEQRLSDGRPRSGVGGVPIPSAAPVNGGEYSQSQPQVIYVPVPAAQPDNSAFADLDASDPSSGSTVDHREKEEPAPRKSFGKAAVLAALGAALVVAVVAGVILVAGGKDKPEPKAEIPPVPPSDGKKNEKPPPIPNKPVVVNPGRKAAEYVVSLGGKVRIEGTVTDDNMGTRLPTDAERLTGISLPGNPRVTDAGLAVFKDCKDIWTVLLQGTNVSDAGLAHFAGFRDLNAIYLERTKITDAGLALLPNREKLVVLFVGDTKVTDAGMAHLRNCRSLQMLHVAFTEVSDAGLAHFKGCADVWMLYLNATKTTDKGLAVFKSCIEMEHLELSSTQVSDASLGQLKSYTKLKVLSVDKTNITPEGIEQLRQALPKCRIVHTDGVIEPKK
jgi:eukaryotic-like serine/threonine-protein kinase